MDEDIKKPVALTTGSNFNGDTPKSFSGFIIPPLQPTDKICAVFPSVNDKTAIHLAALSELIELAQHPSEFPKLQAACIAPHTAVVKTKEGVHAHDSMNILWVDVDSGDKFLDELETKLTQLGITSAIIHSTSTSMRVNDKTNQLNGKKWRILIPLLSPIECVKWVALQIKLADKFDGDKSATRVHQILFAPNNPPINDDRETRHYECRVIYGEPLDASDLPFELITVPAPPAPAPLDIALPTKKAPAKLPEGQIDVIEAYNCQHHIELELFQRGDHKSGNKLLYAHSTSGIPGIIIDHEANKMFSNHESDPLCDGHQHGPFDVMKSRLGYENREAIIHASEACKVDPSDPNSKTIKEYNLANKLSQEVTDAFSKALSCEAGYGVTDKQSVLQKATNQSALQKLTNLSATNRIDEMLKNLSKDICVVDGMALDGQITLFYAKPNTGKTLFLMRFIIDGIRNKNISGADVIYLNADDHYKGLLTKSKLAEKFGFLMISPAEAGVTTDYILTILDELAVSEEAAGMIIIIDTLKKFTDLMNKAVQKDFYALLRRLVAKNATVIIAGHANKKLDDDGKLIYEGTADTMNDVDCAYAMYVLEQTDNETIVEFRQEKSRGDVVARVSYGYRKRAGDSYRDLMDSVYKVDDNQAEKLRTTSEEQSLLKKHEHQTIFLQQILEKQELNQSQVLSAYDDNKSISNSAHHRLVNQFSKSSLKAALGELEGVILTVRHNYNGNNEKLFSIKGAYIDPPAPPKR